MPKKLRQNAEYKKFLVTVFDEETSSSTTYPVLDMFNDDLEYEEGILPVADAKKYYDHSSGGLHFFYNLDLAAKVEASNLKMLRREKAISNMFSYSVDGKVNWSKFLPWLVIILLILFK